MISESSEAHRGPVTDARPVDYSRVFTQAIDRLHAEGRYRVFIDILRNKGMFPNARCFAGHNGPKPITVWCSNDYLGMGQHTAVLDAMRRVLSAVTAGSSPAGGTGFSGARIGAGSLTVAPYYEYTNEGTDWFEPSNLQVTSIDVGNPAANVIPGEASARLNIRFNDRHTGASLEELGQLHDPVLTKDAIAGRIRRLLAMADKRAKDLGIPDTESAVTPDLLEDA